MPLRPKSLISAILVACTTSCWAANWQPDPLYQDTIGSQINVGKVAPFSVLSYGDVDLNQFDNTVTGPSYIKGNVGIGGNGNFSMSDGVLDGNLYVHNGAKVTFSGPSQHGNVFSFSSGPSSPIDLALQDAWNLSAKAASEMGTNNWSYNAGSAAFTWNSTTGSGTVNGNKNYSIFSSGKTVLNLQDFVLTGGSFTLGGTATTTYIINVSRNFSLNNAHVSLDGINSSQVLFNIRGTGSQVSLNQGTYLSGILLATQRKVTLSGGSVSGRVIGNQVNITSGGSVVSQ